MFFKKTIDTVLAQFHAQVAHLEQLAEQHAQEAKDHAETALHFSDLASWAEEEKLRAARVAAKIREFLS